MTGALFSYSSPRVTFASWLALPASWLRDVRITHHVTARGNRGGPIFFEMGDQEIHRDVLRERLRRAKVELWPSTR